MRHAHRIVTVLGLLAASSAMAGEVAVTQVPVLSGYVRDENCTPDSDGKTLNECICKADIVKAQVTGLPKSAGTTINNQLSQVPEQLAGESCAGRPTAAPEAGVMINSASATYETVYQSPEALSVLVTYATAAAGAAHPLPGSEGYTFNLTTGKTLDVAAELSPEQLAKVNEYVRAELVKKHGDTMLDDARIRTEYLTDSGCESCTLYYTKEGWNMRFAVYSVAPYVYGQPNVTIPTTLIPEPEMLMTRKK